MNFLDKYKNIQLTDGCIYIKDGIQKEELLTFLKEYYTYENETKEIYKLSLKGLSVDLVIEAVRFSLKFEDLVNPTMLLNIINLIKTNNTYTDSFFQHSDVYINSLVDFLTVRKELKEELLIFVRQLSIYFISLFKSYSKLTYTPLDVHVTLPSIYHNIINSLDLMTMCGILAIKNVDFNINECMYITNAASYISNFFVKNSISDFLITNLLQDTQIGRENANDENK